jgi:hypothetical protein
MSTLTTDLGVPVGPALDWNRVASPGSISAAESPVVVRDRRIPWGMVGPLAVLLTLADAFWLTALQGAVGEVDRSQGSFDRWLTVSAVLLPLFVLAVLGALAVARRQFGPELHRVRPVLAGAVLIAVAGTALGVGAVAVNSAYDYHLVKGEVRHMEVLMGMPAAGGNVAGGTHSSMAGMPEMLTGVDANNPGCTGVCAADHKARDVAIHGARLAAEGILVTNLVLVGWLVALRGGRLDVGPGRRSRRLRTS